MAEFPDPEEVDRRLTYKLQLWVGVTGAVFAAVVIVLGLTVGDGVSLLSVIGLLVGPVLALAGWRGLRAEDAQK